MKDKGFLALFLIIFILLALAIVGIFFFLKRNQTDLNPFTSSQTQQSSALPYSVKNYQAQDMSETFTDNKHIQFQYPSNWRVDRFKNSPDMYSLQHTDHFVPEAQAYSIVIAITNHCLNTQCLTNFTLEQMINQIDATIVSSIKAQNANGYKIKTSDGKTGYAFIKGKDFVLITSDIYFPYMEKIIPTLKLLASD